MCHRSTFFGPLHNFCSFGTFFTHVSTPRTRTTTKLVLGPLSVARGQKDEQNASFFQKILKNKAFFPRKFVMIIKNCEDTPFQSSWKLVIFPWKICENCKNWQKIGRKPPWFCGTVKKSMGLSESPVLLFLWLWYRPL